MDQHKTNGWKRTFRKKKQQNREQETAAITLPPLDY